MFFDKGFKVAEPGTDSLTPVVSSVQAIGGLQAVAGNAGDGQLIGLDEAMGVEPRGNCGSDAAGRLSKDALGLGQFLHGRYDLHVRHVFSPAARRADGTRRIHAVGRVADGQRPSDRVGPLRLNLL